MKIHFTCVVSTILFFFVFLPIHIGFSNPIPNSGYQPVEETWYLGPEEFKQAVSLPVVVQRALISEIDIEGVQAISGHLLIDGDPFDIEQGPYRLSFLGKEKGKKHTFIFYTDLMAVSIWLNRVRTEINLRVYISHAKSGHGIPKTEVLGIVAYGQVSKEGKRPKGFKIDYRLRNGKPAWPVKLQGKTKEQPSRHFITGTAQPPEGCIDPYHCNNPHCPCHKVHDPKRWIRTGETPGVSTEKHCEWIERGGDPHDPDAYHPQPTKGAQKAIEETPKKPSKAKTGKIEKKLPPCCADEYHCEKTGFTGPHPKDDKGKKK
jgi:hypothetical protein